MKKWAAGITLTGLAALTGGVGHGISGSPPDKPQVKSLDAIDGKAPKALPTVEIAELRKQGRFETVRQEEKRSWLEANHVWPTFINWTYANQSYVDGIRTFIKKAEEQGIDKQKSFADMLKPKITDVKVFSPLGLEMTNAMILETTSDPDRAFFSMPTEKESKAGFLRADIGINKPGGKIRFESDHKHIKITFPDANPAATKSSVEITPADHQKLFDEITSLTFRQGNNSVPLDENKTTQTDHVLLPGGRPAIILLNTAPGVRVNLKGLSGTKEYPIHFGGMDNANYYMDTKTKHVTLEVGAKALTRQTLQNKAVIEVPIEMALKLKDNITYTKDYAADFDGTNHVTLEDPANGIKIISGGGYHDPDPDIQKFGIRGLDVDLRIVSGKHYVDVPLMRDTQFAAKTESALKKDLGGAIKTLDPSVAPKRSFRKDMKTGVLENWQERHRQQQILEARKPSGKD